MIFKLLSKILFGIETHLIGSVFVPFMLALHTSEENCRSLVRASSLSFFVIRFGRVALRAERSRNWKLFHFLVLLDNFKLLVMQVTDHIFLLSGQVVVISTHLAD
jgi:hypothetical protein